jgi:hypothetical protein
MTKSSKFGLFTKPSSLIWPQKGTKSTKIKNFREKATLLCLDIMAET